ncbi:unnamed protein product [Caenorhabditis sp. 36 PRJEB53466]|nr:unnamed protein product [Caenorhabditis sp. 36 PRJEB53466]
MSEDRENERHVSGQCIFRAFHEILDLKEYIYFNHCAEIPADHFYSCAERSYIFGFLLEQMKRSEKYNPEKFEEAVKREIERRDPTPPPVPKKNPLEARPKYKGMVCYHEKTPTNGNVSGSVFVKFLECFLPAQKYAYVMRHSPIEEEKVYAPKEQIELMRRVANKVNMKTLPDTQLTHIFQHFLMVPDVKGILGHEFPIMVEHMWALHYQVVFSKVERIRTEIILIQNLETTAAYVSKLLDVVFERVLQDYHHYELDYFDNRKRIFRDFMKQLPICNKAKGKSPAANNFIKIGKSKVKQYKIEEEVLKESHEHLFWSLQSKAGKKFQKVFMDFLKVSFPITKEPEPQKGLLIFAERFFRWAAEVLEFEKYASVSMQTKKLYSCMETSSPKQIIPLRIINVYSMAEQNEHSFIFVEDLRHALRRYKFTFNDLHFEVSPPLRPGPIACIHEAIDDIEHLQKVIRSVTKDRFQYELEFSTVMDPFDVFYPIAGPFNRHVISLSELLTKLIEILMDNLELCYQLNPTHEEVQAFVDKANDYFPVSKNRQYIDLAVANELRKEAYALWKFQMPVDKEVSEKFDKLKTQLVTMLSSTAQTQAESVKTNVKRALFVAAFPQFGEIVHAHFCTGQFCYKILLPDWTEPPVCNVVNEKKYNYESVEELLEMFP